MTGTAVVRKAAVVISTRYSNTVTIPNKNYIATEYYPMIAIIEVLKDIVGCVNRDKA